MTRVASNQICVITRHGLRFGEVRRIVWRGLGGGLWPCLACGRACCDVWRVVFFNFDVNVSQQSQYSEKTPTTVGCIRICTHVFVKLCGRHEEEALSPSKLWDLNEFEQVYDRKKNNVFKNMSELVKPSGGGRGRTESGGSQETTGLVWSPQLWSSLHRPEPSRETSTQTFRALFQAIFNWDPSTTTPSTDNGLFKPTQIDICHVGESYDAESCREHLEILIQFNCFCKVQKCIHPNLSQPQKIRLQLLLDI